jgi:hypothetical protein
MLEQPIITGLAPLFAGLAFIFFGCVAAGIAFGAFNHIFNRWK